MIEAVICYVEGTAEILDVCLASLSRHDPGCVMDRVVVATDSAGIPEASDIACSYEKELKLDIVAYDVAGFRTGSDMHAMLLDQAVKDCESEFLLTLDSDCFPVRSGWLGELKGMIDRGAVLSGILWPWKPPPDDMDRKTIEYRVRKYHCWNSTQVACQLCRVEFLRERNLSFGGFVDTGFSIVEEAWKTQGGVTGLMPTRGPLCEDMDSECNRMCSVIYGDCVYHHGAATRMAMAQGEPVGLDSLSIARARVLIEKGAEWMLQEGNSHVYNMDREEKVAQFKMEGVYEAMRRHLVNHDCIFDSSWGMF